MNMILNNLSILIYVDWKYNLFGSLFGIFKNLTDWKCLIIKFIMEKEKEYVVAEKVTEEDFGIDEK